MPYTNKFNKKLHLEPGFCSSFRFWFEFEFCLLKISGFGLKSRVRVRYRTMDQLHSSPISKLIFLDFHENLKIFSLPFDLIPTWYIFTGAAMGNTGNVPPRNWINCCRKMMLFPVALFLATAFPKIDKNSIFLMNFYQNFQNFLKISQQFVFFVQTREKLTRAF